MRKIDYSEIKWDADTNWEFCGSLKNLKEVWNRASEHRGVRVSIEEFGYNKPNPGYAYEEGDIVSYTEGDHTMLAVVVSPVFHNGQFYARLADGQPLHVNPNDLGDLVSIADIPDELMALARVAAGKPPFDPSKCPLKDPGACMKGGGEA
jgi:hypothetical protein